MDKLTGFIGRTIYALPFLAFGVMHLMSGSQMAGMVPSYVPGGVFWIYFTGAAMVLAALAIITGKQGRGACFGLALLLLLFIVTVHLPGMANPDPQQKMMFVMNFLKDTSLMGAALAIAGTFKSK